MKACMIGLAFILMLLPVAAQQSENSSPAAVAGQRVIQDMVAGQFDKIEAQYDPQVAAALSPGRLAAVWASLIQQFGPFDSVVETRATKTQNLDVVILVCKFERALLDAQIAFSADGKIAGLNFRPHQESSALWVPPAYAKQDSFTEEPLVLVNGRFELPGTLTVPKGNGPFAAVVLVHGSGPSDEDETVGANKPFRDLAWGLASKGVAVYRYTKRTLKYGARSADDPAKLTVDDETISDARAAVALLAKQARIDPARVFLVGHSLGAYLAPRIASGDTKIAGIAMIAAPTRPMEKIAADQVRYLVSAGVIPADQEERQIAAAEESVKAIENPNLKPSDEVMFLGAAIPASYWLDLRAYHPTEAAASLKIPILILQGGRDYQVVPANFDAWKVALAGHGNVTFKLFPSLNHLFIAGNGPSLPKEYEARGNVAEDVVVEMAAWISTRGRPTN